MRFGVSSEWLVGHAELFDAAMELPVQPEPGETPVAGHAREGRPALSNDLPRTRIECDLSDETEGCIRCARANWRSAQRDVTP